MKILKVLSLSNGTAYTTENFSFSVTNPLIEKANGEKLYYIIPADKKFFKIEGYKKHNQKNAYVVYSENIDKTVQDFIEKYSAAAAAAKTKN